MDYNVAEVMLYNTCNFNCAYCGFVTAGSVKNIEDLAPFRDKSYIEKVFNFFERHSSTDRKWVLHLSGGEPMLMPNLNYFAERFIGAGHKLAYNTNLSLPLDKTGWLDANPPEGINGLIISLHAEALIQFEALFAKVRLLKERGYPLVIRMVEHPHFFERFEELHERFRAIDVSFSVNALYSPNYPRAYTEPERDTLTRYMKTNYEVIRMNGGLDASDLKCFAGSRMLCVGLGVSGGGDVYPCVNTAAPANKMGNIFAEDFDLYDSEIGCLREDKVCSCAIHFTHGVVPAADDDEAHKRMLAGYAESIDKTYAEWFACKGIKTSHHSATPQGTAIGETEVIWKSGTNQQGRHHQNPTLASHFPLPALAEWSVIDSIVKQSDHTANRLSVTTTRAKYDVASFSPVFALPVGAIELRYRVRVSRGGVTIGVQSETGEWLVSNNHLISTTGILQFTLDTPGAIRIVLAACNHCGDGVASATISNLEIGRPPDAVDLEPRQTAIAGHS